MLSVQEGGPSPCLGRAQLAAAQLTLTNLLVYKCENVQTTSVHTTSASAGRR